MAFYDPLEDDQQPQSPLYEALMQPMQRSWQFYSRPSEYANEQLDINPTEPDQTQFDRLKWLRKLQQMGE